MKKIPYFLLVGLLPLLTACPQTNIDSFPPNSDTAYKPLLMSRNQLEASIAFKEARPVKIPGKIYVYGSYILLNELYEGVHIIDNKNPENPQRVGFIQAPGCLDFAVKNNMLYIDNAVDLVTIDMSDVQNLKLADRVKNVFPELTAPDGFSSYDRNTAPEGSVVVGWVKKTN